jgi:GMP synthase (glutamine-hydrolysing)
VIDVNERAPILLLVLGEAPAPVQHTHGPFATWYERAIGEPLAIHDGRFARLSGHIREYAGLVISGSASSLVEPEPWMDDACELVIHAHDVGVPVLGVCFGHQLIGRAFGARVVKNPVGFEIGTTTVELTPAGRDDPLFDGLPPILRVNLTHFDMVDDAPPRLGLLATNDHTPIQALAIGDHVRGVQFHPEITGPIMRAYLQARRHLVKHRDPDALLAEIDDTPEAARVIQNFVRHFVARA